MREGARHTINSNSELIMRLGKKKRRTAVRWDAVRRSVKGSGAPPEDRQVHTGSPNGPHSCELHRCVGNLKQGLEVGRALGLPALDRVALVGYDETELFLCDSSLPHHCSRATCEKAAERDHNRERGLGRTKVIRDNIDEAIRFVFGLHDHLDLVRTKPGNPLFKAFRPLDSHLKFDLFVCWLVGRWQGGGEDATDDGTTTSKGQSSL